MADFGTSLDIALKAIQLLVLIGGGAWAVISLRATMQVQGNDIRELKEETKKLADVLTTIALQKQQLEHLEQRIDELRHGEGFIFPLASRLHGDS